MKRWKVCHCSGDGLPKTEIVGSLERFDARVCKKLTRAIGRTSINSYKKIRRAFLARKRRHHFGKPAGAIVGHENRGHSLPGGRIRSTRVGGDTHSLNPKVPSRNSGYSPDKQPLPAPTRGRASSPLLRGSALETSTLALGEAAPNTKTLIMR